MKRTLGLFLQIAGVLSFIIFGLIGFAMSLQIINEVAGFWGFAIGFVLFPVVFGVAPFYALIVWGWWVPLFVNYGGLFVAAVLYTAGTALKNQ